MLLACCFRDPSKKKHKKNKNWKNENVRDNEESYAPSKSLLSSPKILSIHHVGPYSSAIDKNTKNINICKNITDNNLTQEKHLSPKKLLKLKKDKEELKIHRRSFPNDFISDKKMNIKTCERETKNQIKFPTPTKLSTIQCQKRNQLIPRDVSSMFASAEDLEGSLLSVSSVSLQISNTSLVSSSIPSLANISLTSLLPTDQDSSMDETITLSNYSIAKQNKQKPIRIEEIKKNYNKRDEVIKKIKEESEKNIQSLIIQNQIELEKVRESYAAKLLEEKESHMKNVEKESIHAKNEANETISELNKLIILERGKTIAKQQKNIKHLEEEFGIKNEQLNQSLKQIDQREIAWHDERADVLNEVKRLKAETSCMVKTLAFDYKETPFGEDKKISLSHEVYSLQLVVEMRSGEVRNLRDQLASATQQQEQAEIVKEKLKKATARMEDLEEQLKIKNENERELIDEKLQLEMSLENTSNTVDRISQNMEALQWRIRNNFDLPVDNLQPVKCDQPYLDHPSFLADEHSFDGAPTKVDDDMDDDQMKYDIVTSLSCSDVFGSKRVLHGMNLNSSETEQRLSDAESTNSDCQEHNLNDDGESLDEGVGDISSESEHGANDHFGVQNHDNNNKSYNSDCQISESDLEAHMDKCNSFDSPERERIASIF